MARQCQQFACHLWWRWIWLGPFRVGTASCDLARNSTTCNIVNLHQVGRLLSLDWEAYRKNFEIDLHSFSPDDLYIFFALPWCVSSRVFVNKLSFFSSPLSLAALISNHPPMLISDFGISLVHENMMCQMHSSELIILSWENWQRPIWTKCEPENWLAKLSRILGELQWPGLTIIKKYFEIEHTLPNLPPENINTQALRPGVPGVPGMAMQQAGLQGMQLGPSGRPMFMPQRFQLTQRGEMPQGGRGLVGWLWIWFGGFLSWEYH